MTIAAVLRCTEANMAETTARDTTTTSRLGSKHTAARGVNVILGAWLFISSFLWQHSSAQFWNSLIVGVIVVAMALGAMRIPQLRFVNTVAAVWLFFSIWALPRLSDATAWNHGLVAVGILIASMMGPELRARMRRPAHA